MNSLQFRECSLCHVQTIQERNQSCPVYCSRNPSSMKLLDLLGHDAWNKFQTYSPKVVWCRLIPWYNPNKITIEPTGSYDIQSRIFKHVGSNGKPEKTREFLSFFVFYEFNSPLKEDQSFKETRTMTTLSFGQFWDSLAPQLVRQ